MKITRFTIPIYEYDVIYIELSGSIDEQVTLVKDELTNIKANQKDIDETIQEIKDGAKNGGNHFYNLSKHISIIAIYPHDDWERMKATIAHEKRHLEDRIMEHFRVDDIESAGLLSGYLARYIP